MNYTKGEWTLQHHAGSGLYVMSGTTPVAHILPTQEAGSMESNGHLIATAPDLVEICRVILARWDMEAREQGDGAIYPCAAMREELRTALSKAEGRDQCAELSKA